MKLGIYEKAINSKFSFEDKIIIAKQAGFDFLELSIDETDEKISRLDWSDSDVKNIKTLLEKNGIYFNSICLSAHRKFPFGSIDKNIRDKAFDIMKKSILLAKKLSIPIIQLAGYDVYYEPSSDMTKKNFIDGLYYATSLAQDACIMLAFETMDTPFMGTIEIASKYVNLINSPWLKIYPDIGNLSQFSISPENEIITNKQHIIAFHLKEAIKTKMRDIPFGMGNVNFESILRAIKKTNFNGPFLIEMWSLNSLDETIQENVEVISKAKEFIIDKFKKSGWDNV